MFGRLGLRGITNLRFVNWWAASSGTVNQFSGSQATTLPNPGFLIGAGAQVDGLLLLNGDARANGGAGIELHGGRNIVISAAQVFQNNWVDAPGICGVYLAAGDSAAPGPTNLIISASTIGSGGVDATGLQGKRVNTQAASICRPIPGTGAAHIQLIVTGSILTGNVSKSAEVGTISGDVVIDSNNIGFR